VSKRTSLIDHPVAYLSQDFFVKQLHFILILAISAVIMTLAGFTVGRVSASEGQQPGCEHSFPAVPDVQASTASVVPKLDVPGEDIADLPRYPGSTRVEYRQTTEEYLVSTEVEYVMAAEVGAVHDFYREVFHAEEWTVADLGFYQGEWTFFVIIADREAVVEIEARGPLVEVEIEITEPQASILSTTDRPSEITQ
jgi:hypothetical protein